MREVIDDWVLWNLSGYSVCCFISCNANETFEPNRINLPSGFLEEGNTSCRERWW